MNYFIEGIQGAGKSTLTGRLAERLPEYKVFREGDHNPVELAWCAYMTKEQYESVLEKYATVADEIKANVITEAEYIGNKTGISEYGAKGSDECRYVLTYTRIITDIPGFHKDLEQYEIYNGRVSREDFEKIILSRYADWKGKDQIFECSIFQNVIESQILYYEMTDEEILGFYRKLKEVLGEKEYRILYLDVDDIAESVNIIRRERVDADGNEMWYPLMMEYLKQSPYGQHHGWQDFEDLVSHLKHRKALELRILKEVFPEHAVILKSKSYDLYRGDDKMKIESERLIIRSIEKGDEKAFAEMAKDGSLTEVGFDETCSEWIGDWINEAKMLDEKDDPRLDYIASTVCLKEDGRVIGSVGTSYYEEAAKIGICYFIGAEYRNRGYASEAVKAYIPYFFEHYNEDEIAAVILGSNKASQKTAENSGFILNDRRMYRDIYDEEERFYCFYTIQRKRDHFYHVISDRPKAAGEHFRVDRDHPNGVYDRVQAEIDKVKDIYAHPGKYEGTELEHHTDVALRELALEKIRKEKYPGYPSRMAALYVSREYKEAEQWADYFVKLGRTVYGIAKIRVNGNVFYGDACKCFDGTTDEKENLRRAELYWQNWGKDEGQDPIVEVLVDGDIEVIEIMKEINANLKREGNNE